MIFALLLVGKIGNVGTLGNISWLWVALLMALDTAMDFTIAMGYQDYFVQMAIFKVKSRKMDRVVKSVAANLKKTA